MTSPFDLSIDSGGDQFPVSGSAPRLSWKLPVGLDASRGFELETVIDGITQPIVSVDSGHRYVPWPGVPLHSATRVGWRVRATAEPTHWSATHEFEVGLQDEDWQAEWISPVEEPNASPGERAAHVLTAEFEIPSPVVRARLYATALGLYEASVNGQRAGTAELSPGSTSYDSTLYAQASDVTASVQPGVNRLEIVVSDGWYRGLVGAFRTPAVWGPTLAARAELHLILVDGTVKVVRTDESWTSAPSPIVRADLMGGQTTDFTVAAVEGAPVLVGQVEAPPIAWSPAPPVRVVESRAPVSVHDSGSGVWVVDFGQNASGWIELSDLGPEGTKTTIEYGEFADASGDLSTAHLDSTRPGEPPMVFSQRDEVVSAGDAAVFEPRHTVHGFQYARVTRRSDPFDPASVTMQVVQTDLARTGAFECSDPDLNRLHDIADWSFRGNAVDIPTDCPTRERLGWTGDYQIFVPTATRLYDVSGFTRKWLRSVRDDQLDDGRIANFSPDGRRVKHNTQTQFAMMTGSAGWGDAIVSVPWEIYTEYGDNAVLEENWDAMVQWTDWASATARTSRHPSRIERSAEPESHEEFIWDGSFHWGEWIEPRARDAEGRLIDPVQGDPMAWFMADKGEVGTAYLFRSTATMAEIAAVIGRPDDAQEYAERAARIADAWRTEFLNADGRTAGDTQAAYVRALSFGLIPEKLRAQAAARLAELIHEAGDHLGTGFLSTGDLLPVLVDNGYADVAYRVLLQRTSPSWLNMLDKGATTIWEDWDGIDDGGTAHESLNHYSKGAVVRFLHTHVLGLRQSRDSTAWQDFVVAPVPGPGLTWARGIHESPQGRIAVEWHADADGMTIDVAVPQGSRAELVFPDGTTRSAGAGTHSESIRFTDLAIG